MRDSRRIIMKQMGAVSLAVVLIVSAASCGKKADLTKNLIDSNEDSKKVVNLFGPMEKSSPDAENTARTAFDLTVGIAEKKLGLTVEYRTYTAENYQEKTYDEVSLDRVRHDMDDLYLLNPDTIQILGAEDKLLDLSVLENSKNLREVVKTANTVNGKICLISIS